MLVNCRLDGSNQSLPASSGSATRARERADQPVHRVVGALRIGDVALRAVHGRLAFRLPRRPIFTMSPEVHRTGRLAHQAEIRHLPVRLHPLQHADRAIDRRAFLVAGDQQADRAARRACREMLRGRGDEGGDRPLHVAGAAAVQDVVAHLAAERKRPLRVPGGTTSVWPAKQKCGPRRRCGRTGCRSRRSAAASP